MSDYLAAIAARSVGVAGAVEPRLPGRFESPFAGPEPGVAEGEEPLTGQESADGSAPRPVAELLRELLGSLRSDRSEGEAPARGALEPQSAEEAPPAGPPAQADAASDPGPRREKVSGPADPETPGRAPISPHTSIEEGPGAASVRREEEPVPPRRRPAGPAIDTVVERLVAPRPEAAAEPAAAPPPVRTLQPAPPAAAPREPGPTRAVREPAPRRRHPGPEPRVDHASPPAPRPAPAERGSAPVVRVVEARRASPVELVAVSPRPSPAEASEERTVQVTIGRLEIRAAPLPAPPVRPRAAPAAIMTLDEYLRRCGERAAR